MAKARKSRRAAAAVAVAQSIRVDGGQSTDIGADQRVAVGGSQVIAVGKDRQVQVGGSDSVVIKVDDVISVGGAFSLSVGKDATLEIGGGFTVSAAQGEAPGDTGASSRSGLQHDRAEAQRRHPDQGQPDRHPGLG